jgi:hypothetical protein
MPTILNPTLKIDPVLLKGNRRKVTVSYGLSFNTREEAAGAVFDETVRLMGNDPIFDTVQATLSSSFVKAVPGTVNRVVTALVSQSRLDEDGDTIVFGIPILALKDELFARINLKPFVATATQNDSNGVSGQFGPAADR